MELWTPAHIRSLLPSIGVMVILCALLRLWLGKKPLRIRMIPIQVIAVILVVLEIFKQVISFSKGYDLYHIPLHFCSLVLFSLPAFAFYRGKYAQQVASIAVGFTASVFVLTAIYPDLIYGGGEVPLFFVRFLSFHTVTFHNLAMFAFMLMVALNVYEPRRGDWKYPVFFIGGYCIVAAIISHLIDTNFNNLYRCNVAPLEAIRLSMVESVGYIPTQIAYVLIVTCLDMSFTLGAYHFYRLCRRLVWGKKSKET